MELKLKRGSGRTFCGENWKAVGDSRWERHRLYVPNGREPLMGVRKIGGADYAVFRCLDDSFFAQPVPVCELPVPEDPMEVVYEEEAEPGPGPEPRPQSGLRATSGALHFAGKNWRLAGDSKWTKVTGFLSEDRGRPVGSRAIGRSEYDVFRSGSGFTAVRRA